MSNEDVLMDDPEAAKAASGSVPKSLFGDLEEACDWRYELTTRHGLDPKVLKECYTPVDRCVGVDHNRTTFQMEKRIPGPAFDCRAIGKPLLWNNDGKYKIQVSWSKAVEKSLTVTKATPPVPSVSEGVEHVRQFLRLRPLSSDMDRYVDTWASASREEKRRATEPKGVWAESSRKTQDLCEPRKGHCLVP